MKAIFISDLHLSNDSPKELALFESFLKEQLNQVDALYILGDLFEAWIGDDDKSNCATRVAAELRRVKARGTQTFYMHGNRDFLLGNEFALLAHMTLLPDPSVINLDKYPVLLTHGDILCTDDKDYQRFRRFSHFYFVKKLFLALPLKLRRKIASRLREQSSIESKKKPVHVMDVNPDAVTKMLNEYQVDTMIHGHTHRPAVHIEGDKTRYVLGAWDIEPKILVYQDGKFELTSLE